MPENKKRKHLKISNTASKILLLFFLLSFGTVKNLSAQCPHTPKCPFEDCLNDGLSKATAYQIYTKAHLQELSDSIMQTFSPVTINWTNGKHFRLMNDITDSVDFVIGGGSTNVGFYFAGYFYGGGHKITLAINPNSSLQRVALFGGVRRGGIDSLEVDGYVIKNYTSSNSQVAGIVAALYAFLPDYVFITNSVNNATVTNNTRSYAVAGVVAFASNAIIFNCKNNNAVIGDADYLGGVSGINENTTISYSMNSSDLINISNKIDGATGGIAGILHRASSISNSLNLNVVKGYNRVGGIAGFMNLWNQSISNCINYSFTKGTENVGGILGFMNNGGIVSNNFNSGVVEGASNVGCIIGLENGGTVENNHYDKQMCGE